MKALLPLIIAAALAAAFFYWIESSQKSTAISEGRAAFKAGASDAANPYQGMNSTMAKGWLAGWLMSRNEATNAAPCGLHIEVQEVPPLNLLGPPVKVMPREREVW